MKKCVLLDKEYSSEELCDIERDVMEAIEEELPEWAVMDDVGFYPGTFKVTISYTEEED